VANDFDKGNLAYERELLRLESEARFDKLANTVETILLTLAVVAIVALFLV